MFKHYFKIISIKSFDVTFDLPLIRAIEVCSCMPSNFLQFLFLLFAWIGDIFIIIKCSFPSARAYACWRTTVAQKVHASMEPQSHLAKPPQSPSLLFQGCRSRGDGGPWHFLVFDRSVNHNSTRGKIMLTTLIIVPPTLGFSDLPTALYHLKKEKRSTPTCKLNRAKTGSKTFWSRI